MKNLHDSYRLRYRIYCLERKFLPYDLYPDKMEFDKYDDIAKHFYYIENERVMGTFRIVPWNENYSFPTEKYFQFLLGSLNGKEYPIDSTVEISRLCISKGCCDKISAVMELFRDMYLYCKENSITHWMATFERPLFILLKKYGFEFELLSKDDIEYFGKVNLYGISIKQMEDLVRIKNPNLYKFFYPDFIHN